MGMVVRSNIMALNANRQLGMNNSSVAKNLEKLSSGFRINRAGDDASGLAISEKMKAQIKGLETASMNSQDGISLVQTAEGALTEVHDMLNRMVELSEKSANGTMEVGTNGTAGTDRQALQDEMDQLSTEIERIARSTNFNNIKLLDGKLGLNTNAISTSETTAAADAADITVGRVSTAASGAAAKGKYVLDFNSLKIAKDSDGSFKVHAFGKDLTIAVKSASAAAGEIDTSAANATKTQMADAVKTALENALTSGGKVLLDGQEVTITSAGGKVTVEQTTAPTSENEIIDMTGLNDFSVKYEPGTGEAGMTGDYIHGTQIAANSSAATTDVGAHVDIKLRADSIRNGTSLTIGTKTYTFVTKDANDTSVTLGTDKIDLRAYSDADLAAMAPDDLVEMASKKVEQAATLDANWTVSAGSDGVIHADFAGALTGDNLKNTSTVEGILNQIKTSSFQSEAKLDVKIKDSELNVGDVISIDGKLYEFTDAAANISTTGATAVVVDGLGKGTVASGTAAKALAEALNGSGKVSGDTVRLSASRAIDLPKIAGKGLVLQIGDTNDSFNKMRVAVQEMSTKALFSGVAMQDANGNATLKTLEDGSVTFDISSQETAGTALSAVKKVINTVSSQRAQLGAIQNRLEHTINNLDVAAENMNSANSRIRDTDMAKQMMEYTKMNVLTQAAQAMLAQANQQPQSILQLLQ